MKKILYGLLILSAIQNILLHGADSRSLNEFKELLKNEKYELKDIGKIINNLTKKEEKAFFLDVLNYCLKNNQLNKVKAPTA